MVGRRPDWPSVWASITGIIGAALIAAFITQPGGYFVSLVSGCCLTVALRARR